MIELDARKRPHRCYYIWLNGMEVSRRTTHATVPLMPWIEARGTVTMLACDPPMLDPVTNELESIQWAGLVQWAPRER